MAKRKFTASIPTSLTEEHKVKARKALTSVMEIMQEIIDENTFTGNSLVIVKNDNYEIQWTKGKGETINKATTGMLLEMELYDTLPMQHEVIQEVFATAILV